MVARVSKLNLWLKYYLDESCSTTFLNKTESARKAGYKCKNYNTLKSIGCQNFTKLNDKISLWLDEHGLSESSLKIKLLSLLNAKETKFMKIKGAVSEDDLAPGCALLGKSGTVFEGKDGDVFGDGDSLIAIETDAIETQRRTLDMAIKVRGMNAPEKVDLSQKIIIRRKSRDGEDD